MRPQGNNKGKGETILKTLSTEIEKNHKVSFRRLSLSLTFDAKSAPPSTKVSIKNNTCVRSTGKKSLLQLL